MRTIGELKNLINKRTDPHHLDDCVRISKVLDERLKIWISVDEAELLWSELSDSMAASWLYLPESDDDLVNEIKEYTERDL